MVKKQWTKEDEIALINSLQDKYVDQLIELMNSTKAEDAAMKQVNLTSPTGTGKTKMMAKLINKYPEAFFMVTTLSKGQLHKQVETSLSKDCLYDNYIVFGAMSLKINSILTEQNIIDLLPTDKDIYWIRDEGHINTNKWSNVLETHCKKIINFSATNKVGYGIVCNFTETMMLRTVHQEVGDISTALDKLVEIKKAHKNVKKYNPCAIFKVTNNETEEDIIRMCKRHKLKPITLVDNNDYIMADICEDDNTYDVIINKQKIVEGIDIRRAHVIWMENKPNNPATTVQAIGRCRRNALLWRDDIDICNSKMKNLLQQTRKCFVFYNVEKAKLNVRDGEIIVDLCPIISIEKLHAGHTIYVEDGVMPNGLMVAELEGKTGFFTIETDDDTGFNIVNNPEFYHEEYGWHKNFLPGLDDLIEKLLDKNSEYFKNLVISTKPYIDGQPLWKYTVTNIGPTAKNQPMWHMCVIDGISIDGTLSVKNYTKTYDKDTLGCVIQPNSIDYGERNRLYSAFCTGENLINKTNNNTVYFDSKYHTMCDDIRPYRIFTLIDSYDMQHIIPIKILADLIERVQKDEQIDIAAVRSIFIDWYQHGALNDVVKKFDTTIYTNSLISILGMEDFEQHQSNGNAIWTPIKNVTSKITSNTKLTKYIEQKYKKEIAIVQTQMFPGHNNFDFQKIRNSCLGYCVEYYAKYLLFGDEWMEWELKRAQSDVTSVNSGMYEVSPEELKQLIIIRACMIKYKHDVEYRFGAGAGQYVHSLSVKSLSHQDSRAFIDKVVELGTKASEFIKNRIDVPDAKNTQCDFITKHIIGAADFMDKNTIIDLKCTNHINSTMVKQVLAYHLLSQFRPDLDIKKVIIYDAVSGKFIEIDLMDIKE